MKNLKLSILACLVFIFIFDYTTFAQSEKPYTDGSVWTISFVKTESGRTRDYIRNLNENYCKVMNAAKEANYILDYKIFLSQPYGENDWDMMLMVEYKDYAALDGEDNWEALQKKVLNNSESQFTEKAIARNEIRKLQGGKLVREIKMK
jgi:hypothetical protein